MTIYLYTYLIHYPLTESTYIIINYPPSVNIPGNNWAIRKVKPDGSLAWMAALSFNPLVKSLTVDALEQYVYVARFSSALDVVRFGAGSGAIVDAQT